MLKRMMILMGVIIIAILVASCQRTEDNNDLDLPTLMVVQDYGKIEFDDLLDEMNNIPLQDVINHFEKKLTGYFERHNLMEVISIDIYKESDIVNGTNNKEDFQDFYVDISLGLDRLSLSRNEFEDKAREVNRELFLIFREDTYGYLKLNTLYVEFLEDEVVKAKHSNSITLIDLPID
jgi:hypothetical protein